MTFSASKSEEEKNEKRKNHASKETEFLRLKRTRLGKDDFDPLVVIGRGAFGEVSRTFITYLLVVHVRYRIRPL